MMNKLQQVATLVNQCNDMSHEDKKKMVMALIACTESFDELASLITEVADYVILMDTNDKESREKAVLLMTEAIMLIKKMK